MSRESIGNRMCGSASIRSSSSLEDRIRATVAHGSFVPICAMIADHRWDERPDADGKEGTPAHPVTSARRTACSSPGPRRAPDRPSIKASNWLSHLEYEWESPVWRHWIRFFSDHFRFVRYDERGCGMSDWNVGDVSFSHWVDDLESVADAALPQGAFPLFGVSQGVATSIAYAVRHPERVSRLILYGGYALGWALRGDPAGKREYDAVVDLVAPRLGQGQSRLPAGVHLALHPGSDQRADGLVQRALPPDQLTSRSRPSCCRRAPTSTSRSWSAKVRTPTLVIHAREDVVVPDRRRAAARRPHPRRRVRRAGLEEPHPARGRAGLGAILRRRSRLHGNRAGGGG